MPTTSRRRFLQTTGLATAAFTLSGSLASQAGKAEAAEKTDEKVPFDLGMASYTLRKFDRAEALKMTQRAGLEKICFKSFHLPMGATDEECAAAAEQCDEMGLDLYGGGVIKMSKPEEVENAFRYAKAAGMRVIVGVPYPDVLPLVEKKVDETDICVAIHNHGPGDKMYPTPEAAVEKVKQYDPRIGLCIDIGHTVRIGADPVEAILKYRDRVHDMHLKDVTKAAPDGRTIICGRGVIDLPAVIGALLEINFDKVASFEYEAEAEDPLPGLMESVGYIRGILSTC
jgi:sugar phosphate isomerase/epimerase